MERPVIKKLYRTHYQKYWSQLGENDAIWQPRYYGFNIYSRSKVEQKLDYMHKNPVRAGLVEKWSIGLGLQLAGTSNRKQWESEFPGLLEWKVIKGLTFELIHSLRVKPLVPTAPNHKWSGHGVEQAA